MQYNFVLQPFLYLWQNEYTVYPGWYGTLDWLAQTKTAVSGGEKDMKTVLDSVGDTLSPYIISLLYVFALDTVVNKNEGGSNGSDPTHLVRSTGLKWSAISSWMNCTFVTYFCSS